MIGLSAGVGFFNPVPYVSDGFVWRCCRRWCPCAAGRRDRRRREGCASETQRGHREGIAPSGGLMERYSGATMVVVVVGRGSLFLSLSLSPSPPPLCFSLFLQPCGTQRHQRNSLPFAVSSARGQRAHAPPSASYTLVKRKKRKRWFPARSDRFATSAASCLSRLFFSSYFRFYIVVIIIIISARCSRIQGGEIVGIMREGG